MSQSAKVTEALHPSRKIKNILITLPYPRSNRSPYFDLAEKHNVNIQFFPFIEVEGLDAREFRKQKIEIADFTAVIFVSRNAVDHFFRICEELKYKVSQEMKYFCASEAVALYLQKFIQYRRRKVFFSADRSTEGLIEVLRKHKSKEKIIFPVSEFTKNDISPFLSEEGFDYNEAIMYRTVNNDIKEVMKNDPDLIVFFSPFSIDTLFTYNPAYEQGSTYIGAFGPTTCQAVIDKGLRLDIEGPKPEIPSMSAAVDLFLEQNLSS